MTNDTKIRLLLAAMAAACIGTEVLDRCQAARNEATTRDTIVVEHRDTVRDTITIRQPRETQRTIVRTVTVPVHRQVNDTLITDTAMLPIEQALYEDSTYRAWVSGYQPQLDSIQVFRREVTVFRDRTVTVTQRKQPPRLSVGLTGGAGYGLTTHRPDVFIGLGVTYRLW